MDVRFILAVVIALIVTPIALSIGSVITYETTGSIETESGSYAENTINDIESGTSTAYGLASLLPLIVAAVGLISAIVVGFYGMYVSARR